MSTLEELASRMFEGPQELVNFHVVFIDEKTKEIFWLAKDINQAQTVVSQESDACLYPEMTVEIAEMLVLYARNSMPGYSFTIVRAQVH